MTEFVGRLERACTRAEQEFPLLAAPDGTVAVQFTDLRAALTALSRQPAAEADEVGKAVAWAKEQHACADRYAAEVELLREALRNFLAEADAGHVSVETDRNARTALNRADNAEGSDHAQP